MPGKHCRSCPGMVGIYPEATEMDTATGGGCLPSPMEIKQAVHQDAWWECHSRPGVICQCAVKEAKQHAIPVPAEPTAGETFGLLPTN